MPEEGIHSEIIILSRVCAGSKEGGEKRIKMVKKKG